MVEVTNQVFDAKVQNEVLDKVPRCKALSPCFSLLGESGCWVVKIPRRESNYGSHTTHAADISLVRDTWQKGSLTDQSGGRNALLSCMPPETEPESKLQKLMN